MVTRAGRSAEKVTRILASAEELLLKRGFRGVTIADIAERAHVGKGTVYLYWSTKEDVFLELLTRDVLTLINGFREAATRNIELTLPHRLCSYLVRSALERPLVRALQANDADVLGLVIDHPRSQDLVKQHGAPALIKALLPIWRRHGLVRTDWELDDQAYALQSLTLGHLEMRVRKHISPSTTMPPEDVLAAAVAALLGVENEATTDANAVAAEVLQVFTTSATILEAANA
ncbi:helix-turn-helix domain-containing protein [Actinosynnema sp. NPDC047251]|uniref:HTH tetR-type domain-containing protein n=1 Tax=Saccharothrix espanaensis (strain ATCC 51144 / DSM 44229 / JCM 9112 / NBRC 15066 / NRRL 15764) TaxID=1179773 RepID=K0JW12_SACES|nr:helix-turn-helix domain-containing protein [Saccharothrix espanaensis]CCH30196.1 hypothetical protein BN6_28870 [Saccharothrix espanaensis DSM 44229]